MVGLRLCCAGAAAAVMALTVVATAAALPTASGWGRTSSAAQSSTITPASLKRCLRERGARVTAMPRTDTSLRALHDLAQRRSFVARTSSSWLAVAVPPTVANAQLLTDAIAPHVGYRAQRFANVVVLTRARDRTSSLLARACTAGARAPAVQHTTRRAARTTASTSPSIFTVAGTGVSGDTGDGGAATNAQIDRPRSVVGLTDGSFLFVQPFQYDVRRVAADGTITRFAGNGNVGYSGDGGPATQARLDTPHTVSPTSGGTLLADTSNNRIRKILTDGTIVTVAGTGVGGYAGDGGPATSAQINAPRGVVALPGGGFLIPDSSNHRVRRVWPDGTITTVAGTGVQGYGGDGGPATSAQLNIPFGVSPMADGGFLIDDVGNQRVRRVWPDGTITTVAGNGVAGYTGDGGPATSAELNNPHNVWATSDGGFLIADCSNNAVRKVSPGGTIATTAGTGTAGFSGDGGPAAAAQLNCPKAVTELPSGALLVADTENSRVRYIGDPVAPSVLQAPAVTGSPQQGQVLSATSGSWSAIPVASYAIQWQRCNGSGSGCADILGATGPTYTVSAADIDATLRAVVTATNVAGPASAPSLPTAVATGPPAAPVNTTPPTVAGTAQTGQTLTASPGTWTGSQPIAFAYQWQRCDGTGGNCSDIAGAADTAYTLTAADVGSTLRVTVAASNAATNGAYRNAVTADSPRSYWRFDEASGALVDLRGFENGTYLNSPTRAAPGLLPGDSDTSVLLDGTSQYLDVPSDAAWTTSPFTIEILVRPAALPSNKTIWSAIGAGFTGWWLNTGSNGQVRIFIGDGTGWRFDDPNVVLNAGTRYLIAASYDGSNARLYVNGALVSTGPTATLNGNTGGTPLRFGAFSTGPGQYWPGKLDDASFYSGALTGAQLANHYQASVTAAAAATSAASAQVGAAAPVNTALPVVSGTAQVGQVLSVSNGSWSNSPTSFAYQWQSAAASSGPFGDVAGATGASYTAASADNGRYLRAVVTAANAGGQASAQSAPVGPVAAATATPVTVSFTVGASGDDGDVSLRSSVGNGYPPSGTAGPYTTGNYFTVGKRNAFGNYQIFDGLVRFDTSSLPDNAQISSATLSIYAVGKVDGDGRSLIGSWYSAANWPIDAPDWTADAGTTALTGTPLSALTTNTTNTLTLQTPTLINLTGYTGLRLGLSGNAPANDNYLQIAAIDGTNPAARLTVTYLAPPPPAPVNTALPVVSGTAQVGQVLSVSNGSWSNSPTSFAYQWQSAAASSGPFGDVAGATGASYTAASADNGRYLRAVVTAANAGGQASAQSAPVGPVAAATATPVTVSFTVGASGDDGDVSLRSSVGNGYPPSGTAGPYTTGNYFTVGKRNAFGNYQIFDGLVRFDTSSLPDNAQISSATLSIYAVGKVDGDGRSLIGSWYSAANWPIDAPDWTADAGTTALTGTPLSALTTNTTNTLTLQTPTLINLTGYTGLRLGLSGNAPANDNYLQIAAIDGTNPAARLTVTYTLP